MQYFLIKFLFLGSFSFLLRQSSSPPGTQPLHFRFQLVNPVVDLGLDDHAGRSCNGEWLVKCGWQKGWRKDGTSIAKHHWQQVGAKVASFQWVSKSWLIIRQNLTRTVMTRFGNMQPNLDKNKLYLTNIFSQLNWWTRKTHILSKTLLDTGRFASFNISSSFSDCERFRATSECRPRVTKTMTTVATWAPPPRRCQTCKSPRPACSWPGTITAGQTRQMELKSDWLDAIQCQYTSQDFWGGKWKKCLTKIITYDRKIISWPILSLLWVTLCSQRQLMVFCFAK